MRIKQQVDGWTVTYELATPPTGNALVVKRLTVAPQGELPARGVTKGLVASLNLGAVCQCAPGLNAPKRPARTSGPGRPPLTSTFYAAVATRYMELLRAGHHNIPRTLAAEFGYKRSSMRAVIRRARRLGKFNQRLKVGAPTILFARQQPT